MTAPSVVTTPSFKLGVRTAAAVSANTAALSALSLLTGALALLTWGTWGDIASDTGYDLVAGARVAAGELPYGDFVYYYGPLAPALLGLSALVGGSGLAPGVAVGLAIAVAIVIATYALGRALVGPLGGFLAAAITAGVAFEPTNFSFVLPHTYAATLAVLLSLGFLLALGRGQVALAGALAGAVALTRPEFAAAVALGGILWIAARARAGMATRADAARLAAPAAAIPLVVYGVLAAVVGPRRLVLENLLPVGELDAGAGKVLGAYTPMTLASFAELGVKLGAYAIGAAALAAAAIGVARLGRVWAGAIAGAAITAAAGASIAKPEALRSGLYLVFEWIPAGACAALVVLALRAWRRRESSPLAHLELAALAMLVVLAAKTYAGFLFHAAPHAQMAAYAAPLAAIFLVRLHLGPHAAGRVAAAAAGALWLAFVAAAGFGLTWKDARAESAVVDGPGGALRATPAEAATYEAALRWIAAGSAPDDSILVAPQLTMLHTLSGRAGALDRISILPGAVVGADEERAAVARLERSRVRMVVLDRRAYAEYGHTEFGGSFGAGIDEWLRNGFVKARTYKSGEPRPRPVEIWVRRGS